MKTLLVTTLFVVFGLGMDLSAKRKAPEPVVPVVKDGIEYSVSKKTMGFVTAKWIKTGQTIWTKQIYTVKFEYKLGLERDIQDCFISYMKFRDGKLTIRNEAGSVFQLDTDTLEQTTVAGSPVVDHTKKTPKRIPRK